VESKAEVVYALIRVSDGRVKVGSTNNITARLSAHRRKHGEIRFLGTLPGYRQLETEIHERWAKYQHVKVYTRDWGNGSFQRTKKTDWFDPAPPLLAWIAEAFNKPIIQLPAQKRVENKSPVTEATRAKRAAGIMMLLPAVRLRDQRISSENTPPAREPSAGKRKAA
jgi:predicted GIY-YIG superfamily endonuclease